MVDAVLFDLDDTLVDHRGAVSRGLRVWLDSLGFAGFTDEHLERWFAIEAHHYERAQRGEISYQEHRRARIRAFFADDDLSDDDVADDTYAGFLACYRAAWAPHDDARDALDAAVAAGLTVGVLTNGEQASQVAKIQETGLARSDLPVFASSELPAAKPDPRSFHAACSALGVEPHATVMVGDSLRNDAFGARDAGLHGVLLDRTGRYRDRSLAGIGRVRRLRDLSWGSVGRV